MVGASVVSLRDWRRQDVDWWVDQMVRWRPTWAPEEQRSRAGSDRWRVRRIAELSDGTPVGVASASRPFAGAGHVPVCVLVVPAHRGHGVGRILWQDMTPRLRGFEVSGGLLSNDVQSLAIVSHWGFHVTSVSIEVALDLADGVPAPPRVDGVTSIAATWPDLLALGVDVEPLLEDCQTHPEAEQLGMRLTGTEFAEITPAGRWVVLLESDRPIAVSIADASDPDEWYIFFSGVARAQRRRGLARLLKQHVHAKARLEGARRVLAENEERNTAIRRLNESLGYHAVGGEARVMRPGMPYDGSDIV